MLQLKKEECGQCGACVATCRFDALRLSPSQLEITMDRCTLCGECVLVCPVYALEMRRLKKYGRVVGQALNRAGTGQGARPTKN